MNWWRYWGIMWLIFLSACSRDEPLNNPHSSGLVQSNTLLTAFTSRSPKYLDPASSYSGDESIYTYHIYEPLYDYHYLKRPYELIPRAAARIAEPQFFDAQNRPLSSDAAGDQVAYSVYDIPLKKGILFQPHPAFAKNAKGEYVYHQLSPQQVRQYRSIPEFAQTGYRELSAQDYVYAIRRLATPRIVSPIYAHMSEYIVGFKEYGEKIRRVDEQLKKGLSSNQTPPWLDFRRYDFEGVQALDDHTLRIKIKGKYPQFRFWLAMTFFSPIPWEADYFYSQSGMLEQGFGFNSWPVGTGPYMMTEYRQNRRHVLSRNPNFRGEPYPCEGAPGDKELGLLKDCGQLMPFIDQLVFSIEKEGTSLQGKFMQGYYDIPEAQRGEYGVAFMTAMQDSQAKANLFKERGLHIPTSVETQIWYIGFNWLDPVVGAGSTPMQAEKNRLLRQAISIAFDWEEYVALFEQNQAEVAHGPVPPGLLGYQPLPEGMNTTVYEQRQGQVQRKTLTYARTLLTQAGYPNGRDAKTGKPLVLYYDAMAGLSPTARSQFDWMAKQFAKLNIQLEVRSTDYNTFQDKMGKGSAQIFLWGWMADYPDPENFLFLLYGPNSKAKVAGENASNYQNPEFDRLFEKMMFLPDGPEREQLIHQMIRIVQHDAAWMFGYFPKSGGVYHQWVANAKPTQMIRSHLQYMRLDPQLRQEKISQWNSTIWWPLVLILLALIALSIPAYRVMRRREQATALGRTASKD